MGQEGSKQSTAGERGLLRSITVAIVCTANSPFRMSVRSDTGQEGKARLYETFRVRTRIQHCVLQAWGLSAEQFHDCVPMLESSPRQQAGVWSGERGGVETQLRGGHGSEGRKHTGLGGGRGREMGGGEGVRVAPGQTELSSKDNKGKERIQEWLRCLIGPLVGLVVISLD